MDPHRSAVEIASELKMLGVPARAVSERAYLKSNLAHYGTSVPIIRTVVKRFLQANPALTHDELLATAVDLWQSTVDAVPIHEHRLAAVELLDARPKLLTIADVPVMEVFLREAMTWALVDTIAGHVVGRLVANDPAMFGRFFSYADALLPEREFFIRKVLGWVARETGRRHPDDVSAWLRRNQARMNGVTIREAVKYLPDAAEVLALWKTR